MNNVAPTVPTIDQIDSVKLSKLVKGLSQEESAELREAISKALAEIERHRASVEEAKTAHNSVLTSVAAPSLSVSAAAGLLAATAAPTAGVLTAAASIAALVTSLALYRQYLHKQ